MAGRISAAAQQFAGTEAGAKIAPPAGLTKQETTIWERVVMDKPANWFTSDNVELLKVYCRAAAQMDWLADRIASTKVSIELAETANDLEAMAQSLMAMSRFQQMEDKYGKTLMNAATKLRMTPQAQITATAAGTAVKKAAVGPKPYESSVSQDELYEEISDEGEAGSSLMN